VPCHAILAPTRNGTTARIISRCKPSVWIIAPSRDPAACQSLAFSYGVQTADLVEKPDDWRELTARWLRKYDLAAERVMLVAGPSSPNPRANHRIELMRLDAQHTSTAEPAARSEIFPATTQRLDIALSLYWPCRVKASSIDRR
jgi:pyruvate kinase